MLPLLFTIGVLYLAAVLAGRLSAAIGIPRVTGYLVVGLASGPSAGSLLDLPGLMTKVQLASLGPLHDMILGLIVFTIGGSFRMPAIRKVGPRLLYISAFEIGFCALLAGLGTRLLGASPLAAAFLAVMAVTTAPAATQMVVREYRSEGPLTDTILPLVGINNLVAILAFLFLNQFGLSVDPSLTRTVFQVLSPLVLGLLGGLFIGVMDQRLTRTVERQMLVLGTVALTTGVALRFELSAMLAVLVAGAVAMNAAARGDRLFKDLTAVDYPLYVFFFIMAGAKLQIEALFHMGSIGAVYVAARVIGKYLGCRLGVMSAGMSSTIRTWLGPAMLAQAGLAIGLADVLAEEWPVQGPQLQTVILASVVIFEMIGPLLTRTALVNAGEVTVLNLLDQRSPTGYGESLRQVLAHLQKALGISFVSGRKLPEDIRIAHIMRRNVEVLAHSAHFDEVVRALAHSRYDRMPVVDDQGALVGIVKYADVADTLFDPGLSDLVVAAEIATDDYLRLTPEDSLKKAMTILKDHPKETHLLVVSPDNPRRLIGIVSHNDLLSARVRRPSDRRQSTTG